MRWQARSQGHPSGRPVGPSETGWQAEVQWGTEVSFSCSPLSAVRGQRVRPGEVTQPSQPSSWLSMFSALFPPNMPLIEQEP